MTAQNHDIWQALATIVDPELSYSIVELGLVRLVQFNEASGEVLITMTLTGPACPLQDHFRQQIRTKLARLELVRASSVEFVFDPPWSISMASEDVRADLALRGLAVNQW